MAARGKPTASERAALGRPASLGQHYDVINDQLLNTSFFRDPQNTLEFARHSPDMKTTCNTFSVEDSFSGRLDGLNIPLDQKLGLMFGVHEKLERNYDELIRWKKTTHRIITGTLIHTIYTTTEELDTSRALDAANVLKTRSSRYSKATHVVSGITRGYQLILTFHRRVLSSFETEVVKTELKDFISEVRSNFTNPDALRDIFRKHRHFDLEAEAHGYVKQAYETWDVFCDKFPEWLKGISANKDQPIIIKLHPIEPVEKSFTEIGKGNFLEIEDHFQGINSAKCALMDFYNDVRANPESITRPKPNDINKLLEIREKIDLHWKEQIAQFRFIIESTRSKNETIYPIFSKYLINESKIMKELSKFENSVAAHAVIAEMKARGCRIIHPQSKLQETVDSSFEILVFNYYPKHRDLFKSAIWIKNYQFFINVMKKSTQKYEFYLMEHENPGRFNRFVGTIFFSNPSNAYVTHYYCGKEKSNNCVELPDYILLNNMAESLANPHQEAKHDTDVQTNDLQNMIENCDVITVSKQITYAQALRNDPTVVSVQESYTHSLTESPYAKKTEAGDQVRSSTNLVVLQPDSQQIASSEAGNRKPTITLDGEFGNAELTAEELRHNLKVFGGSVSRPSKAVHRVGCPEYNVKGSDNSDTFSGNNDPSCDDETSSISREEGQHSAMASSKDYDPLNRMQNQSTQYGCPKKLSGLGRGVIAGIPNREVAVTSNLFASKSTIKSDLFSSEVQETRSQIIQNERGKITAKDNDHINDVRNLVEDPNDIIKCNPKTNESGNGSKKVGPMGRGQGRGRPPIICCTDATKRNSKANECEIENSQLSIHRSLASAEPSHNNDESEKDAMKNYASQVTAMDKDRESDFCQNNYNNGTSKPSQKCQSTDEAAHPYDGGRNGKKSKNKQTNGKSKDKTEAEEPSIYIKDQVKYEQLQFLTDLFQDQETDTAEAVDTVFPDETDITCLANSGTDFEKTPPLSEEELQQFPVLRMKCPAYLYGNCELREVHEWVCNNCQTHLLYGLDTYIYCVQCGKTRANVLSFKCSHVTHGDEFFAFPDEDELLGILEKLRDRDELNILILGETGVGKTTFINAFANYLTYDTLSEAEKSELIGLIPSTFTLSDENYEEITIKFGVADSNESEEEGASKTQACKCYSFPCGDKMVKLIDTPGIGDTKGIDQDAKNFVNILSFISNFSNIHGILLLMKPNNDRLNIFFRFCIQELLKHLHKSASENINFVFTNSKSTFYRPGDTFRPLKKLLSELQDITIPLNADTIYCLDNDSFRFLVASHNNVKFTENDLKEYTTSWAKSAKECERLLKRVAQLKPHSVKDTLSINGARRLIVLLAQPLGDIIMVIQENLYFLNEQMKTLAASQNNIEKLRNCLFVPAVEVKLSHYPNPRTICKATSCSKITENGEYPICHDPCYLTEITPDIVNNEQLKKCAVINDSTGCCHSCGCSWKGHMRVLYEMKKINVKKMDNTAASGIQNWKARQEKAEETKLELELRRKEFLDELDYVTKASAIFTYFLMKNSLTQQSDFIKNYLEALIEIEKRKQNLKGGSCSETSGLIRELQKAVAGYSKELDRLNREGMEVTAQEIEVHASRLYSLEKFGSSFKSIAEKHEEALSREVALYSERVYVPKSGGNGKARRNKRFHFNATED